MSQLMARVAVLFASLGGILCGYYNSSFNGILEMAAFQSSFPSVFSRTTINSTEETCSSGSGQSSDFFVGFIASSGTLGSVLGSILAGKMSDIFSRRVTLAVSGLLLMLGSATIAASYYNSVWMLLLGRTMSGVNSGFIYVLLPIYIGEMAPKERRGLMMSTMGPGFAIGMFIGFCGNVGFARFEEGWRFSCGVLALGGLVYAIGFLWLPYTPRWLVLKNRDKEALLVLSKINGSSIKENFIDTYLDLEDLREAKNSTKTNAVSQILKWKYFQRLILMLAFFFLTAQVGTLVTYFPTTFFCLIGISQPFIASIILGTINIIASILSALLLDKMGRKITLISASGVNVVIVLLCGILLQTKGYDHSIVNYIVVVFICIHSFSIFYAWNCVPWIVAAEVFPLHVKGTGSSISNSSYWFFTFLYNFITPRLVGPPLNLYGYLYLTTAVNLLVGLLVLFAIPETKGVSLEHIDDLFDQKWIKRIGCGFSCRNKNKSTKCTCTVNQDLSDEKSS